MSKELILLVGPPGSGKSTLSKYYTDRLFRRVNQDEQGKEGHREEFLHAIMGNRSIIIDRMNFSKEQRERYLKPAREVGYTTKIIVLHVPKDECYSRCIERENHPTIKDSKTASKAINMFFSKYERVEDSEADVVERHTVDNIKGHAKPSVIICDLDGTLCNIDHRLHFMKQEKKDFKNFFYNIPGDSVNHWCEQLIHSMVETGSPLIFCSGRPDDHIKSTQEWLKNNNFDYYDFLFMRQRGDFRQDYIIKEIILEFEILPRYNVLFAIDDRQQVVDMWRKHGITCLQCANGDF